MSTKAIKEAVMAMDDGTAGHGRLREKVEDELETLAKMARTIITSQDSGGVPVAEADAAWERLRALAKETP